MRGASPRCLNGFWHNVYLIWLCHNVYLIVFQNFDSIRMVTSIFMI